MLIPISVFYFYPHSSSVKSLTIFFSAAGSRSLTRNSGLQKSSRNTLTLSSHPSPRPLQQSSTVYHHPDDPIDETYEVYDPSNFTTFPQQRQQQAAAPNPALDPFPDPLARPSSALGSPRSLRRTPRLNHRRAASVDVSGRYHQIEQTIPVLVQPASGEDRTQNPALRPAISEARTDDAEKDDSEAFEERSRRAGESFWPRRSTRVSPRTASAILWTLEEAIRKPFPFTTDWDEVNASMADLAGAPGSSGPAVSGRTQNGAARTAQGPVPVNPHPPSGVRTPTDIMRQRRDREARKKAEQEARAREQEEAERRQQEEQANQAQQTQPYAAGVAGEKIGQRGAAPRTTAAPGMTTNPSGMARRADSQIQPQITRQPVPPAQQVPGAQQPAATKGAAPASTFAKPQGQAPPTSQSENLQNQQQPRRVGFPHAFERWETLSSHWEGLTSYWIRKLEQNNEALERDPLSQQMARQVTDLSAAGANLFHAVVELQRLRASSERKFQRWFFDTRAEQERAKELQAELEKQVKNERQARAEAVASLQKAESDKTRAEELLREMRRELQISKEEARRAWEELGRREQEERERTNSLRNGEPTLVGGVQVVPMIQGLSSRQTAMSHTSARESPYSTGENLGKPEGQYYDEAPVSPVATDPFTEGKDLAPRQPATTAADSQVPYASQYYPQQGSNIYGGRPASANDDRSYDPSAASSEPGDEEYGSYRHTQGRPVEYPPTMSEESDEYELEPHEEGYASSSVPASSGPLYTPTTADYTGSGWGVGAGWESMTPRHRHPTRLSDVLEEDEPRTTPSRASRASRASQASRSVQ
ncbi:hypothetical protein CNMCM5793_002041 [Aspergillus hiratsukae]|uniref:Uncharacterized protein n=1 Tax=Aspergillus hiratsukae TaxID=1194566 RepID=A0A8H6PCQ9_9EURO|nr:hypothetical protein CNMCM5793_002041 [Aspergillus hiratsukae]KAF7170041.1 hypothetical protein CNMCM6106_004886 [Aspergillus hiratsukae]